MDLRKIGLINKESDTRYVTLPKGWGKVGSQVLIYTISEKELKLELVEEQK